MNDNVTLTVRVIDVALASAVIRRLGDLNGDEIEVVDELCQALDSIPERHGIKQFNLTMLQQTDEGDPAMKEIDIALTRRAAAALLNPIYTQVKAFPVSTRSSVIRMRKALKAALESKKKDDAG